MLLLPLGFGTTLSSKGISEEIKTMDTSDLTKVEPLGIDRGYESNLHELLAFGPGLNLVLGLPGSGKSYLLEAMELMFGITMIVYDEPTGPVEQQLIGGPHEFVRAMEQRIEAYSTRIGAGEEFHCLPILQDSLTTMTNFNPRGERMGTAREGRSASFTVALRKWNTIFQKLNVTMVCAITPPTPTTAAISDFGLSLKGSVTAILTLSEGTYTLSSRRPLKELPRGDRIEREFMFNDFIALSGLNNETTPSKGSSLPRVEHADVSVDEARQSSVQKSDLRRVFRNN